MPAKRFHAICNDAIDCSILLLLFLSPLFMGGRHPIGQWIYLLAALPGAVGLALRCAAGDRPPLTTAVWCLLGAVLLLPILQVIPLDRGWIASVTPGLRFLSFSGETFSWPSALGQTWSLTPAISQRASAMLACYVAVFTFTAARLETRRDVERLLRLIMLSAGMLAIIAILQVLLGNGRFLWIYDHPTRDHGAIPRGPFQNENHFCHVLAVALPIAIYFLAAPFLRRSPRQSQRSAATICRPGHSQGRTDSIVQWSSVAVLVSIFSTVLATPSRGGIAIVCGGVFVLVVLLSWHRLRSRMGESTPARFVIYSWAALATAAASCIGLTVWKMPELSYWRWKIWSANWAIFQDFPLLGTGLGTHAHVYRAYLGEYFPQTFSHAESSWLQILSESGMVGFGLLLVTAGVVGRRLTAVVQVPLPRIDAWLWSAISAAILISGIHACFDFPWHIPACAVPLVLLLGIAYRLPPLIAASESAAERIETVCEDSVAKALRLAVATLVVVMLGTAVPTQVGAVRASLAWDAYRRLNRGAQEDQVAAENSVDQIRLLRECLRADPHHIQARSRLLRHMYLQMQSATDSTRRAALGRQVVSQARALAYVCPTHSDAPLLAAAAGADVGQTVDQQEQLLKHALRLRPTDGRILTRLALLALMERKPAVAERYWQRAINDDPGHIEETLTYLLIFHRPGEILVRYQPSREVAESLLQKVAAEGRTEDRMELLVYVSDAYRRAAREDSRDEIAEQHLETAFRYATQANDFPTIISVLEARVQRNPDILANQLLLARYLLDAGDHERLARQLDRCARLAPGNRELRELQMQAARVAVMPHPAEVGRH